MNLPWAHHKKHTTKHRQTIRTNRRQKQRVSRSQQPAARQSGISNEPCNTNIMSMSNDSNPHKSKSQAQGACDVDNSLSNSTGELFDTPLRDGLSYQLVHQGAKSRIYRSDNVGIKVLTDPNMSREIKLALLNNELRVANSLPASCSKQRMLRVDTFQDHPALYFEWVQGVSIREWIESGSMSVPLSEVADVQEADMLTRLQVAIAITKAVADFHEAGVVHGHVGLSDVILYAEASSWSATLIDYSVSIMVSSLTELDHLTNFEASKRIDLNNLGAILYAVFGLHIQDVGGAQAQESGCNVDVEEDPETQRNKRGKSHRCQPVHSLPLYLVTLLVSLLTPIGKWGNGDGVQYTNAQDVLSDLQLALDKPDTYLKETIWEDLATKPLALPQDSFYGRKTELSLMKHAFDVMMEGNSRACALVVSGPAGVG